MSMFTRLMTRLIRNMERRYSYDAAYMHEILDTSPRAMVKLLLAQGMNLHHEGLPQPAWHAARIVTASHEDCGPCTQLVVDFALAAGVERDVLRAVVAGDYQRLPADALLGARFAEAVLANADTGPVRNEVMQRFGRQGVVSLAYAIAFTRVYPTLKRAMGYAHTCQHVIVDGESVTAARSA